MLILAKKGSRFALDSKRFSQDLESKDDFCFFARELLEKAGFSQYEVSNYAKDSKLGVDSKPNGDSKQCKHNLGYWQGREYIGCGAGAVGRLSNRRLRAYPQLANYIKTPRKRLVEALSQRDLCMENIMLGLRCAVGVKVAMEKHIGFLLSGGKCHIRQEKREEKGEEFLVANELFLSDEIALWLFARA